MPDNVIGTYGGPGDVPASFSYCGLRPASGEFVGSPDEWDVFRIYLRNPTDYVDLVVTGHGVGDPSQQIVWVVDPGGGVHLTYNGVDETGSGTVANDGMFGFDQYFEFRVGCRFYDLDYCIWFYVNGEPIPPSAATHFEVTAPPSVPTGEEFEFTVTAKDADEATATDYSGTVHFTTTDDSSVLPADTVLTAGTGTFPATLYTLGTQTIAATDTVDSGITGSAEIEVSGFYDGWWGLAHSGRDTFWAARTDMSSLADEFTWDGDIVQTIQLAYPARHAWLGPET